MRRGLHKQHSEQRHHLICPQTRTQLLTPGGTHTFRQVVWHTLPVKYVPTLHNTLINMSWNIPDYFQIFPDFSQHHPTPSHVKPPAQKNISKPQKVRNTMEHVQTLRASLNHCTKPPWIFPEFSEFFLSAQRRVTIPDFRKEVFSGRELWCHCVSLYSWFIPTLFPTLRYKVNPLQFTQICLPSTPCILVLTCLHFFDTYQLRWQFPH